jgi:quercetin dioxygenase-like cupin family protein
MRDAASAVDLTGLAAAGNRPGALWRLDGEDLQANLIRLGLGDRIQPHRNDEVEVLMVVVAGRGDFTLDGQVHPLAPMALGHVPKGTVRAVVAVDEPLAYLAVHRRRSSGLQVGRTPSGRWINRAKGTLRHRHTTHLMDTSSTDTADQRGDAQSSPGVQALLQNLPATRRLVSTRRRGRA